MAEEIKNKFVSWTLNVVKEIKEIPSASRRRTTPAVCGVGINLSLDDDRRVVVSNVHPDGPAAKAGLRPLDALVEVDGVRVVDDEKATPADVARLVRGVEGSIVEVVLARGGKTIR